MTHLAFATCQNLPAHEHDDVTLHAMGRARGFTIAQPVWNDPQVDWEAFDAVVIRTTWDYTRHLEAFTAWTQHVSTQTQLINPHAVIGWNCDKRYLRAIEAEGLPIVPTTWVDSLTQPLDLEAWASTQRAQGHTRGFIKPVVGANASGTHRFDLTDGAARQRAQRLLEEQLAHGALMVQPYRQSVESFGEVSLICFGGEVSHAVQKIPVKGDYRVQDDWGASDRAVDWRRDFASLEPLALDALACAERLTGERLCYARVDFLRTDEREDCFEINELEAIEPSLFFRHGHHAEARFLDAVTHAMT